MGQLVGDETASLRGFRAVPAVIEDDVRAMGKGQCPQLFGRIAGYGPRVDSHGAEIGLEARFKKPSQCRGQCLPLSLHGADGADGAVESRRGRLVRSLPLGMNGLSLFLFVFRNFPIHSHGSRRRPGNLGPGTVVGAVHGHDEVRRPVRIPFQGVVGGADAEFGLDSPHEAGEPFRIVALFGPFPHGRIDLRDGGVLGGRHLFLFGCGRRHDVLPSLWRSLRMPSMIASSVMGGRPALKDMRVAYRTQFVRSPLGGKILAAGRTEARHRITSHARSRSKALVGGCDKGSTTLRPKAFASMGIQS
ncbi:MAG: hypothetical protein V2B20_23615 [Pseudomonadota bacterium]